MTIHPSIAVLRAAIGPNTELPVSTKAQASSEIQLLPAGWFKARDGRPLQSGGWLLDAGTAKALIAAADARSVPYVIDYEHQTLKAANNGQPSPAAGWFKKLEWREGVGLFAVDVMWTDRARAMIAAKEYRFLSPVFSHAADSGQVLALICAALTNTPALDELREIALSFMAGQETPLAALTTAQQDICEKMGIESADYLQTLSAVAQLKRAELSMSATRDTTGADGLTGGERDMCRRMGLPAAEFLKAKGQRAR